ncbi:hypothetical protein EDD36DRAFT_419757 [Exophiala viscosa]|uniref:C2H2-type domain-containing protein n=1 Tax=Exophiala viscosa TaxID=2486360 RepID=A0AAN6ICD8_9EURO|nr:hypothetical protein EDD36DRAFT_419757 [Exophiala viscosa]
MSANENHQMGDDDPRLAWPQGSAMTTNNLLAFSDLTWPENEDDLVTDHQNLNLLLQPLTHFETNNNYFDDSLLAPNNNAITFDAYSDHPFAGGSGDQEQLALHALEATDFGDLHVRATAMYDMAGGGCSLDSGVPGAADGMGQPQGAANVGMVDNSAGYMSGAGTTVGSLPQYGFVVDAGSYGVAGSGKFVELKTPFLSDFSIAESHPPAQVGYPDPTPFAAGPFPTVQSDDTTYPELEPFSFNVAEPHPVPYRQVVDMDAGGAVGVMPTFHGFDESFNIGDFDFSAEEDLPYSLANLAGNVGLGITYDYGNVTPSGASQNIVSENGEEVDIHGLDDNGASHYAVPADAYDFGPVGVGDPGPVSVDDDPMSTLYTRPGRRARFDEEMDDVPDVPADNDDSTSAADTGDTNKLPARRLPKPRGKRKASADDGDDADEEVNDAGPVKDTHGHYPSATAVLLASTAQEVDVTAALNDPAIPKNFKRKLPTVADEPDPWACHICYHAFIRENRLREHYLEKHPELRLTRRTVKDYEPAQVRNMQRLSWYIARGDDTTYRGPDRKQFNARRRMAAGIKTDGTEYLADVYKKTPAERAAAQQPKKKAKKTEE